MTKIKIIFVQPCICSESCWWRRSAGRTWHIYCRPMAVCRWDFRSISIRFCGRWCCAPESPGSKVRQSSYAGAASRRSVANLDPCSGRPSACSARPRRLARWASFVGHCRFHCSDRAALCRRSIGCCGRSSDAWVSIGREWVGSDAIDRRPSCPATTVRHGSVRHVRIRSPLEE